MQKASSMAIRVAFILLLCALAVSALPHQVAPKDLVALFLDALNSKDEAKIRDFLEKHASGAVPIDQRISRLKGLADMGAPIKMLQPAVEKEGTVRTLMEDKNGERLGLILELSRDPEPKIAAVRLGPPEMLDAPAPKDYTGWQDLDSLGAGIRIDTVSPAIGIALLRQGKLQQTVSGLREVNGKDPVVADDPWSLGSIGKPICSTILGRLIETGKLRWDLTLAEAFPDLPMKPGYKNVTIEQIMHHRGGIPQDMDFRRDRVVAIVAGATDPMKMRENYARDILGRDPIASPGERFAYSNAGYALLGIIAERALKKPYESLVHEIVFEPLGLKHSYTGADKLPDRRPSGHVQGPQGLQRQNMSGPLEILVAPAGGGLFTSVADLARFGAAHLKGLRGQDGLLKAATVQRLHQGVPEERGGLRLYACGWGIEDFPGIETMHTHNGSNGTFRSQLSIFPKADLVVAAFVSRGGETDPSPPLQAVLAIAKRYASKAAGPGAALRK